MSTLWPLPITVSPQVIGRVSVESADPDAYVELGRWWLQECHERYGLPQLRRPPEGDFTKIIEYRAVDPLDLDDDDPDAGSLESIDQLVAAVAHCSKVRFFLRAWGRRSDSPFIGPLSIHNTSSLMGATVQRLTLPDRYVTVLEVSAHKTVAGLSYGEASGFGGLVLRAAAVCDPTYGEVAMSPGVGLQTLVEKTLRRPGELGLQESRRLLRGEGWLTVVPGELADRLGGLDRLMASSAFAYGTQLPSGAVALTATETYEDFDTAAERKVVAALRPVLPDIIDLALASIDSMRPPGT